MSWSFNNSWNYNKVNYQYKIGEQEEEDRQVTTKLMYKLLSGGGCTDIIITPTKITDPVDLEIDYNDRNGKPDHITVEVKSRNKNEYKLEHYPYAELTLGKMQRIRDWADGGKLLYIQLLNKETAYIYYITDKYLNESAFQATMPNNKVTEFNPCSERKDMVVWELPYSTAYKAESIKYFYY